MARVAAAHTPTQAETRRAALLPRHQALDMEEKQPEMTADTSAGDAAAAQDAESDASVTNEVACFLEQQLLTKVAAKAIKKCRVKDCETKRVDKRHLLCDAHRNGLPVYHGTSMWAFCRRGSHFCPWNAFEAPATKDARRTGRRWELEEEVGETLRRCCRPCLEKRRIHRFKSLGRRVSDKVERPSPQPFSAGTKATVAVLRQLTEADVDNPAPAVRRRRRSSDYSDSTDDEDDNKSEFSGCPVTTPVRRNPPRSARGRRRVIICSDTTDDSEAESTEESVDAPLPVPAPEPVVEAVPAAQEAAPPAQEEEEEAVVADDLAAITADLPWTLLPSMLEPPAVDVDDNNDDNNDADAAAAADDPHDDDGSFDLPDGLVPEPWMPTGP